MPDKNPCDDIEGPAGAYCTEGDNPPDEGGPPETYRGGGLIDGAADNVKDLAIHLIKELERLVAPEKAWAPAQADSALYQPFLWLGQHLAVAIFVCVGVVCALTAWQGAPRLKQMGTSTGWTLAAVVAMGAIPGAVMLLNKAVSAAFTAAFDSNESTLFKVIRDDLENGADAANPLAVLLIVAGLVVALAVAALVFMTRQLGILAFVCMAPLVLASLARGGDTTAVEKWAMRLLGLLFAPFALLLISPFIALFKGSVAMDLVLLLAADVIMLRMIFLGVPYIGPRVAGAARTMVERHTTNPLARGIVRAGVPTVYEQENSPRAPRTVDTPGRAMTRDRGVLLAAYGLRQRERPGRLTTPSAVAQATRDTARTAQISQARRQARAAAGAMPTARQPGTAPARPAAPQPGVPSTPPTRPKSTQPSNTP